MWQHMGTTRPHQRVKGAVSLRSASRISLRLYGVMARNTPKQPFIGVCWPHMKSVRRSKVVVCKLAVQLGSGGQAGLLLREETRHLPRYQVISKT